MKNVLNDQVRLDRRKKGFNASINSLFDFSDRETWTSFFDGDSHLFDLVDRKEIQSLASMNPAPNHYGKFLFNFINAKIFLENNVV